MIPDDAVLAFRVLREFGVRPVRIPTLCSPGGAYDAAAGQQTGVSPLARTLQNNPPGATRYFLIDHATGKRWDVAGLPDEGEDVAPAFVPLRETFNRAMTGEDELPLDEENDMANTGTRNYSTALPPRGRPTYGARDQAPTEINASDALYCVQSLIAGLQDPGELEKFMSGLADIMDQSQVGQQTDPNDPTATNGRGTSNAVCAVAVATTALAVCSVVHRTGHSPRAVRTCKLSWIGSRRQNRSRLASGVYQCRTTKPASIHRLRIAKSWPKLSRP
jgi:hypothetical protein